MFLFKVLSHSSHLEELARNVASALENELGEMVEEKDGLAVCRYHLLELTRELVVTFIQDM